MKKLESGQSLFELVVAIAISALIIVAVVSLASTSIRNSDFSKNKSLAATYAQEATEWLRGQRDADINAFVTHAQAPTWCFSGLNWNLSGPCGSSDLISGTPFTRQATFTESVESGKNVIQVDVTVSWRDAQGLHEVVSATGLTDWRQR
jgi:Tfp pilus assembly protein PilV